MDRDRPLAGLFDGIADQRVLVAVRWRGLRPHRVVHVDRIAPDLVRADLRDVATAVEGGVVEHLYRGAAHALERDVADIDVGALAEEPVTARAGRIGGPEHDVPRQIARVRQEVERVRDGAARAEVIELERRRERHLTARDGSDRSDFPLGHVGAAVDRVLADAQLPRVGNQDAVARAPLDRRLSEMDDRVALLRLRREARERRRQDGAVHVDAAEADDTRAILLGVCRRVQRHVGEDDFRLDARIDRIARAPDFQHARILDHQRADLQPGVDVGAENELAVDVDAVQIGAADRVGRDNIASRDPDAIVGGWHPRRRPGRRTRPVSRTRTANRG